MSGGSSIIGKCILHSSAPLTATSLDNRESAVS
jgi:hypothetical protein